MHKSIATINSPEFINLQPLEINPLMSKCEIKVLYIGENRNHTFISKETATEMAKTLRGAPIVGYYKKDKEDFADHGHRVILDDEGIKFECLTVPYGFVSPDAKVWFQEFEDTDDFGNKENREYLMTTGYLWTGQFEECKSAVEGEGKPHSMELDENSLDGHWETNKKTGMDFFIINDATFSKLCILGEDVEPCFEGSKVSAPEISSSFTKIDDDFKKTLFTMMQDLQFALKGEEAMENETKVDVGSVETAPAADPVVETPAPAVENATSAPVEEFKKTDEEDDKKKEGKTEEESTDNDNGEKDNGNKEEDDKEKKYTLLQEENAELKDKISELEIQFSNLNEKYQELVKFKAKADEAEKDAMIAKFSMLTDEDKAEVIENKAQYSVEDIESKLSVICVRKKVNFDLSNSANINNNMNKGFVFSLEADENNVPAWIKAVKNNKK